MSIIEETKDIPLADAPSVPAENQEGDTGNGEPRTLREEIQENFKAAKEKDDALREDKAKPVKTASKPEKSVKDNLGRDEQGRFAQGAISAAKPPEPTPAPPKTEIAAPLSWKSELKAKWSALPAEVQAEISRREMDVEKRFTTMDEDRKFAKSIKDVVTPYMPIIQAEGGTAEGAVKDLLNSAYVLRTGTPQQKLQLIIGTAQRFGVDLKNISQASLQPDTPDPVAIARDTVRKELETYTQQQETTKLQSIIDAFANDPANVHYEKVKPVMAALLTAGTAADMKEAYERACYADPEIRASLKADEDKANEAKRIADLKAKAGASRYAASSVRGSSPVNGADTTAPVKRSLREEITHNFRMATQH